MTTSVAPIEPRLSRGQRIWEKMLDTRASAPLSLWRARLLTAAYRENEGLPVPIKRARAFEKIVTGIPIFIEDDQLLVGDFASAPQGAEWFPEGSVSWVLKEMEAGEASFYATPDELGEVKEICEYWKPRCLENAVLSALSPEEKDRLFKNSDSGSYVWQGRNRLDRFKSYFPADYQRVIKKGLLGIIADIEKELKTIPVPMLDVASVNKANFLRGMIIAYQAAIQYAGRYARLARETAQKADRVRAAELERIVEICERIPAKPARNFREALQSLWFSYALVHLETRVIGIAPGRADQYLYPYYKQDVEAGKISREEAIELLECLRTKMSSLRIFSIKSYREGASGEAQFHNITLGGQTPDGKDATNDLSYLFLEAAFKTKTPHPTLSVRLHKDIPQDFALRALELAALGNGYPAFFGDKSNIGFLADHVGWPLEEARNYALGGCVNPHIAGKTGPGAAGIVLSPAKAFELALHDGLDPFSGTQLGPHTGKFEDFKTYDDLMAAFLAQVKYFIQEARPFCHLRHIYDELMQPALFYSGLTDDCIQKGTSAGGEGLRMRLTYLTVFGMIDVVDSLAAIKKCVYEDRSLTAQGLIKAIDANFKGMERVRDRLLAAPKYGNDDDYADNIAHDIFEQFRKLAAEELVPVVWHGQGSYLRVYSHSIHFQAGKKMGALPSGRLAGVALADGGVSPSQGVDVAGPTAVINSAVKIDQTPILSTLLNMKFLPGSLKTREELKRLLSLINTYFDNGGKHIQFNVVSRDVLLDAQAHPERHRGLIVRVAGYSALFNELDRGVQDDIIRRTENTI